MKKNRLLIKILVFIVVLIGVNFISSKVYSRLDLTQNNRYTLSTNSQQLIETIDAPLIIDMFLEGDLPSEFRLLRNETKQILEEFSLQTNNLKINYINPIEKETTRDRNIKELTKSGLTPYINTNSTTSKVTQEIIFPWCFASYKGNMVKIPLLKRSITEGLQEQINNSIQSLEYAFADGFSKLINKKTKKIAILKGNGQLDDIDENGKISTKYLNDFLKTLKPYYNLSLFTLDSVKVNPERTLDLLKTYDLIISAKPTKAFSEEEKLVLDQYTMNGGKSLWLTESVIMDKDSLYNNSGADVAIARDLNLTNFFFKYGVRVNPTMVKDLYSAPIMLSIGEGNPAPLQPLQWQYSPLAASNPNHPITKNINLVKFDFASPIDTLKNGVKKTILLQSSPNSKLSGTGTVIALADVTKPVDEATYNMGPQNLAVLLEGQFTSVFDNAVLPIKIKDFKTNSDPTKMVIVSDGDVIKNKVLKNRPQELGFDQLTGKSFGNKEFLLNTVNYLLDDNGLINIRGKEINVSYLDADKLKDSKLKWQLLNIVLPIGILVIFGFVFNYLRQKKYA